MPPVRINLFVFLSLFLLVIACKTSQKNREELSARCCQECREAFSQSPVGVGAAGAKCGAFTSAKPVSQPCQEYFKKNPRTVAECE